MLWIPQFFFSKGGWMSERVRAACKARQNTKCGFHSWKQTIRPKKGHRVKNERFYHQKKDSTAFNQNG
jgi:hypothetical protein